MKKKIGILLLSASALLSLAACGTRTYYVSPPAPGSYWVPGHYDTGPYGGQHWIPGHYQQ
jgi:hypothetical protein